MSSPKDLSLDRPVLKLGMVEDEATGDVYTEFAFLKPLNRRGTVLVENDKAREPAALTRTLLQKGADLPLDRELAASLVRDAIAAPPARHRLHASHLGWRRGGKAFVLPRPAAVIGASGQQLEVQPPAWLNDRQDASFAVRGTLPEWVAEVAEPARHSDLIQTVIAAAFGAVLLPWSGLQNFGLNLFGGSKSGKTTALLCGTSVGGIGRERDLPNWNATTGGFLETARWFNDRLLPANEVGALAGKRRDAYGPIRERIFAFSEGRDRARVSGSVVGAPRGASRWSGIFVSTAEFSFTQYAGFAGETRAEGEYARCLDIPARQRDRSTVFNRFPDEAEGSRSAWARAQLTQLRCACERQCGTPLVAFVEYVIAEGDRARETYEARAGEFLEHVNAAALEPWLEHAAKNMAHVYAAGCTAIDAAILPWTGEELLRATAASLKAAVAEVRRAVASVGAALRTFRERLASSALPETHDDATFGPDDYPGFFEAEGGKAVVTLHARVLGEWLETRVERVAVLKHLYERGCLLMGDKAAAPSPTSTEWAQRTPQWPDGRVHKSYVFTDPFGVVGNQRG